MISNLLLQVTDSAVQTIGFSDDFSIDFLGIPLLDGQSLLQLLIRFGFNLLVTWIIIHMLYYRKSGRRDYYNTFLLFSVTIFLLIFLLDNVKLQMGFALGLFAIFGMIRYRTETVPIREMTYLFMIIGISVINGLAMTVSYVELFVTNLLFILVTWFLEFNRTIKHTASKIVLYDKIQLILPEKHQELMNDLCARTGLNIIRFEIGNVDFLKDVAFIKIYYKPTDNQENATAGRLKVKPEDF